MVQVSYITLGSVCLWFTQLRAFGPRCVNHIETFTLWYTLCNLYMYNIFTCTISTQLHSTVQHSTAHHSTVQHTHTYIHIHVPHMHTHTHTHTYTYHTCTHIRTHTRTHTHNTHTHTHIKTHYMYLHVYTCMYTIILILVMSYIHNVRLIICIHTLQSLAIHIVITARLVQVNILYNL